MEEIIKTPLAVNMINIIGNIGTEVKNPLGLAQQLVEKIKEMDNPIFGIRFGTEIEVGCPPRKTKKIATRGKYFYNCVEVFFYLKQRIQKPKIFTTGVVHIPGCRKVSEGVAVIELLIKFIKSVPKYEEFLSIPERLKPEIDFEKKVYTTQFEINCSNQINQLNLARVLRNEYGLIVLYEPRNYPGVIIHYHPTPESPKITIIVQRFGKATINGGNHIRFVIQSYNFIIEVFRTHPELLRNN